MALIIPVVFDDGESLVWLCVAIGISVPI